MNVLVTGCAGFIGWKTCEFLLTKPRLVLKSFNATNDPNDINVVGVDNLNDYYDVRLKKWRLRQLLKHKNFTFKKADIENYASLRYIFMQYSKPSVIASPKGARQSQPIGCHRVMSGSPIRALRIPSDLFQRGHRSAFDAVINLAARAGVRYSMVNPHVYYTTNVIGNLNLLELCREYGVKKYVFASTSSLYAGQKMPFKETLPVNEPISPYAASKKAAEVTCYTYHKLYGIDVTILRYFTVYGPAGRPDMSIFRFISWIDKSKPIIIYGNGKQTRDFTYVDDIARGTIAAMKPLGFEIINLGSDHPHQMLESVHIIGKELGKKTKLVKKPMHPADIFATWANINKAKKILGWEPEYSLANGLRETIQWYTKNKKWVEKVKIDMGV